MKKALAVSLGLALAILVAGPAFAQMGGAKVGLEGHGLYAFNFNDDDFGSGNEPDNTFGGGGSLVIAFGQIAKLDLGADYLKPELKSASSEKFQLIPVAGTLRIGGTVADALYLYGGGGAGYSFNEYDGTLDDALELEDCFTYHACGGLEICLSPNLALRGEFRYVWMKPDVKEKATGAKESIKLDHMQVRAGLGVYF